MSTVDWTSLDHALPGAPDVAALAAGLEGDVPAVLLPVRIETRFDTVEMVADAGNPGRALTDALGALRATVRTLADRGYATTPRGSVTIKKQFKNDIEKPLYALIERDLDTAENQVSAR